MSQCDLSQNLLKRGCKARYIENPRSFSSILKNKPLSSKGSMSAQYDVIQIQPQKISLSLRPGMVFVCKYGWIWDLSNVLKCILDGISLLGDTDQCVCFKLIQVIRPRLSCRFALLRIILLTCITWWTSRCPWRTISIPFATWEQNWLKRWRSSLVTSVLPLGRLWIRTCLLFRTLLPSIRRTPVTGKQKSLHAAAQASLRSLKLLFCSALGLSGVVLSSLMLTCDKQEYNPINKVVVL